MKVSLLLFADTLARWVLSRLTLLREYALSRFGLALRVNGVALILAGFLFWTGHGVVSVLLQSAAIIFMLGTGLFVRNAREMARCS